MTDFLPAPYAGGDAPALTRVLADLLPADVAPTGRDVVVLLDGVGHQLLREHRSLTPTLRGLEDEIVPIRTVAPTTTATAMASLLTGLSPLEHGILGLLVLDPAGGPSVHQLTGSPAIDPVAWMPLPGLIDRSPRPAIHVGPRRHEGSHLTRAIYRGWEIRGHARTDQRVETMRTAVRRSAPDSLLLLHVNDVDHAGHVHGVDSDPWREALAEVDSLLAILRRVLPHGTRITVTADHGMVDRDPGQELDLGSWPELRNLITAVAGEPRALALRTRGPEATHRAAAVLRDRLAGAAEVLEREALLSSGVLGPEHLVPDERVLGRVPDLLLLAHGRVSLVDSAHQAPPAHQEIGMHGSLTAAEAVVPLLRLVAGA